MVALYNNLMDFILISRPLLRTTFMIYQQVIVFVGCLNLVL